MGRAMGGSMNETSRLLFLRNDSLRRRAHGHVHRPGRLFAVSAAAVLTTLALVAAPAAAQEVVFVAVEGSPDSVLSDAWTGTQGSAAPQDCSASPPAGIVTWLFVLPQADPNLPENIFESVTLQFEGAGEVAGVVTGAYAVAATPTDDILLGGTADVLESALDGVPPTFDLVSTCSTIEPPPPETTTTTTTTVPDTEPPTTPPPTTAPPDPTPVPSGGGGSGGGSGGGGSGGGDAPLPPPTPQQVLWSAAAFPLPFSGSPLSLASRRAVAQAADLSTAPSADAAASVVPSDPAAARPRARWPRPRMKRPSGSNGSSWPARPVETGAPRPARPPTTARRRCGGPCCSVRWVPRCSCS